MGRLAATDMVEQSLDRRVALEWHLRANHYPPIPRSMLEPCEAAMDAVDDGDGDREIGLPEGVTYHGHESAPAQAIVDGHHLEPFLSGEF